ncbi:MAG: NAD-dependent deacylase [Planctomycetes bacterium]|nr:NAD-dependent deacylase [Planctomycetota bacterium]
MDLSLPNDLLQRISEARRVAVLTGAGVSAESGLSTFRGPGGLWENQDLMELATPQGFARDPKKVWEWYAWRREQALVAQPNAGHLALARWEEWLSHRGGRLDLITQNVDGLHQAAGSKNVIELHGSGWVLRCTRCGRERLDRTHPLPEIPPRCGECQGLLRPGVVWFGEMLPPAALVSAQTAAENCELFLVAGTSGTVYPAAGLVEVAARQGAATIEANLEPTPLSDAVDWSLRGRSGEILPSLIAALD